MRITSKGDVTIPIIYSEVSVGLDRIEDLDAAVRGVTLLTRDARRCHSCFPKLKLISP